MSTWYEVKQMGKEMGMTMPELLEKIVREWLREN